MYWILTSNSYNITFNLHRRFTVPCSLASPFHRIRSPLSSFFFWRKNPNALLIHIRLCSRSKPFASLWQRRLSCSCSTNAENYSSIIGSIQHMKTYYKWKQSNILSLHEIYERFIFHSVCNFTITIFFWLEVKYFSNNMLYFWKGWQSSISWHKYVNEECITKE